MSIYKILVEGRNYSSWSIYETVYFKPLTDLNINPIENKLFSNDFFTVNDKKHKINRAFLQIKIYCIY
jgi:hypothetical protein